MNEHLPEPHHHRLRAVGITAVVVAIAALGTDVAVQRGWPASRHQQTVSTTLPVSIVAVTRMDLADTVSFDGSIAYGLPRTLKGTGTGIITKLPPVGAITQLGIALYSVNDRPVPVFFGDTPLFRPVGSIGMAGSDVAMVASNLAALGLIPPVAESNPSKVVWTSAMRKALGNLQAWVGLPVTRTLAVGDVVVLDAPARVDAVTAHTGDSVGSDLLTLSSEHRSVIIQIKPSDARRLAVGTAVTVTLTNGTMLPATIASIASPTVLAPEDGAAQGDSEPLVTVTADPNDDTVLADVDDSPVRVSVTTQSRTQVLTVPVDALLGLREGGYALQTDDGRLVPVTLGMISGDLVEVSGPDLSAGTMVVTAT